MQSSRPSATRRHTTFGCRTPPLPKPSSSPNETARCDLTSLQSSRPEAGYFGVGGAHGPHPRPRSGTGARLDREAAQERPCSKQSEACLV